MPQLYIYLTIIGWLVNLHPFYLTLTEIRQNPDNRRLEIAQKIFWDDLEVALADFHDTKIDFLHPDDPDKLNSQIREYLLSNNELVLDGTTISVSYLGYEVEEEAAWFYLESEPVDWPERISIRNTLLIDNFPSQQNIVHVYHLGSKNPKSLLLSKRNEWGELRF